MFTKIKSFLYFPVAGYFRFFAKLRLRRWNPRIIVITGSSGKTTLLHLVESQLGSKARYTHEANSAFGIPFNILDIHRKTLTFFEWPWIVVLPIINFFKPLPKEKIYVVEADCDRPNEGSFLADLLNPEVTLWTNVSRTHSMNFENMVKRGKFKSIDEAISKEFSSFGQKTGSLVIANSGSKLVVSGLKNVTCNKQMVSGKEITSYKVDTNGTIFRTTKGRFIFPYLLPEEFGVSILISLALTKYLKVKPDLTFSKFNLAPGRNSVFKGIKGLTLVDSSYNANFDSMKAILNMFGKTPFTHKWVVLGDMLEQGNLEKEEHTKLATLISKFNFERVILMGPRVAEFTYPNLVALVHQKVIISKFLGPKEVLNYLKNNIHGGEAILFKGARFLEGVIENLLLDTGQSKELARREKVWHIRRKKWGL